MKKIVLLVLAVIVLPLTAAAQNKKISDIFDKYEKKSGVESISISPALLDFMDTGSKSDTKELLSRIEEMRILNVPNKIMEKGVAVRELLRQDLLVLVKSEQFSRVVKVDSEESSIEMYMIKGNRGVLLFMTSDDNSFTAISILGDIDKTVTNAVLNGGITINKKR